MTIQRIARDMPRPMEFFTGLAAHMRLLARRGDAAGLPIWLET